MQCRTPVCGSAFEGSSQSVGGCCYILRSTTLRLSQSKVPACQETSELVCRGAQLPGRNDGDTHSTR